MSEMYEERGTFMSSPISSLFPNDPPVAASVASNQASAPAPTPKVQPVAKAGVDTVQLTVAQQVYQLYNQGQQVSQIATSLSLSESQVNSYLNVSGSSV